jgi:hypothetical protein
MTIIVDEADDRVKRDYAAQIAHAFAATAKGSDVSRDMADAMGVLLVRTRVRLFEEGLGRTFPVKGESRFDDLIAAMDTADKDQRKR